LDDSLRFFGGTGYARWHAGVGAPGQAAVGSLRCRSGWRQFSDCQDERELNDE